MLYVVNSQNKRQFTDQLEESFRVRHQIYVEERGWNDLRKEDQREVDQFDNDDAIYLLFLDETRSRVLGGSRLIPTTKPHLMSEVFPNLASMRPLPRAPSIYEWTRFYVVEEARDSHRTCRVADMIMCGVQEYCLGEGITQLSIVTEPFWIPRFLDAGWKPRPLGLPIKHDGMDVVGITVEISEEALAQTRATRDQYDPVVVRGVEPSSSRAASSVH